MFGHQLALTTYQLVNTYGNHLYLHRPAFGRLLIGCAATNQADYLLKDVRICIMMAKFLSAVYKVAATNAEREMLSRSARLEDEAMLH